MSGGGNCLPLDPPSKEQREAEERVRNALFSPQTSIVELSSQLNEKYNREAETLRKSLFPEKIQKGMLAFDSLAEEYNHPQMKEFYQKKEQDIRNQLEYAMLQSPMFVEKDQDGISCMNVDGTQCMSLNSEEQSAYPMNPNLPRWTAEVDEFFPEPLQPFSF
jgi:hypothetical protein